MDSKKIEVLQKTFLALDRAMGLHARNEATCCGVTLPQCHVIMEIGLAGRASVRDLSGVLGLDKSTLSRTIDSLVETGLVDRTLDSEDRRYVAVSLTKKGIKSFERINSTWLLFCGEMMKKIPLKKHQAFWSSQALKDDN